MARTLTFSRTFPAYHSRKGQPTFFLEKIMASFADNIPGWKMHDTFTDWDWHEYYNARPKNHTIRAGKRWKVGDYFCPRYWTGSPYNSKRDGSKCPAIGPNILIRKVLDFEMYSTDKHCHIIIDGEEFCPEDLNHFHDLMYNDGLSPEDFSLWFQQSPEYKKSKKFSGQIICWSDKVKYVTGKDYKKESSDTCQNSCDRPRCTLPGCELKAERALLDIII